MTEHSRHEQEYAHLSFWFTQDCPSSTNSWKRLSPTKRGRKPSHWLLTGHEGCSISLLWTSTGHGFCIIHELIVSRRGAHTWKDHLEMEPFNSDWFVLSDIVQITQTSSKSNCETGNSPLDLIMFFFWTMNQDSFCNWFGSCLLGICAYSCRNVWHARKQKQIIGASSTMRHYLSNRQWERHRIYMWLSCAWQKKGLAIQLSLLSKMRQEATWHWEREKRFWN